MCSILGHFAEFETRMELSYFSNFGYFDELRPERSELRARFLPICTDFRAERSEALSLFLAIFSNLRPERTEHLAAFLAIFTNFRQETNKPPSYFLKFETRKE